MLKRLLFIIVWMFVFWLTSVECIAWAFSLFYKNTTDKLSDSDALKIGMLSSFLQIGSVLIALMLGVFEYLPGTKKLNSTSLKGSVPAKTELLD